jgi:hypothetical protein
LVNVDQTLVHLHFTPGENADEQGKCNSSGESKNGDEGIQFMLYHIPDHDL